MVIFVCAIARGNAMSQVKPPSKWRMLTPLLKPSRLISINFSAGPWNHVADIQPSECHTVRNRSQSPASRQSAQLSINSRIASFSPNSSSDTKQRPPLKRNRDLGNHTRKREENTHCD